MSRGLFLSLARAAGQSFSPSQLPGVRFWFDGDNASLSGSNVESLTNLISGEANALKVSDPTRPTIITDELNGHSVVDFNGTDQRLNIGITDWQTEDQTWFIVFKSDDPSPGTRQTLVDCWTGSSSGFHAGLLSNQVEFFVRSTTVQAFTDTASYHVLMVKNKNYGNSVSMRVFKVDNGTAVNSVTSAFANLAFNIGIGGRYDDTLYYNGKIAEIIGCEDVITETDEQKIYSYLNTKYGLAIPTTMPEYTFNSGTINYSGTYDAITTNLIFSVSGKTFGKPAPVLWLGHGYQDTNTSFTTEIKNRLANKGFYLVAPNGRGQAGGGGTRDSSGREILDHFDALKHVLSIHPDLIDISKRSGSGYSGGGGWITAITSKIPNLFAIKANNFGITDYIFDYASTAWFAQATPGGSVQQQLELDILGLADRLPQDYLNEAKSRDHRYSSINNLQGELHIIHDEGDTAVQIVQSDELWKQVVDQSKTSSVFIHGSGPSNTTRLSAPYTYNIQNTDRYTHGYPASTNPGLIASEDFWLPDALVTEAESFKSSGTARVSGFFIAVDQEMEMKFEIFLGLTVADGKSCEATLVYNYDTNSYTITPIFYGGETQMEYSFEDDLGRVSSGTITGETSFTPI